MAATYVRVALAVALLVAAGRAQESAGEPRRMTAAPSSPLTVDDALGWCPEDSVFVAVTTSSAMRARPCRKAKEKDEGLISIGAESGAWSGWADPFDCDKERDSIELLESITRDLQPLWAVDGVRRYVAPSSGLGPYLREGFRILAFEGDPAIAIAAFERERGRKGRKVRSIEGHDVLVMPSCASEKTRRGYIVRPAPGWIIAASDESSLRSVLRAQRDPSARTNWSKLLPEWKQMLREGDAWMFERASGTGGPRTTPAGMPWVRSFALSFRAGSGSLRARVFSDSDDHVSEIFIDAFENPATFFEKALKAGNRNPFAIGGERGDSLLGIAVDYPGEVENSLLFSLIQVLGTPVFWM